MLIWKPLRHILPAALLALTNPAFCQPGELRPPTAHVTMPV